MNYQIYKLRFKTGVHLGGTRLEDALYQIHADTIFSALCLEYLKYNTGLLNEFIEKFESGKLLISDALPFIANEFYVPKPMCTVNPVRKKGDSKEKKAYKKLSYIPIRNMQDYLRGELDIANAVQKFRTELGYSDVKTQVSLRGEEVSRPYRIGIYTFKEGSGLYLIVGYKEKEDLEMVSELLTSLSFAGIGGKRSSGLGKFDLLVTKIPDDLRVYLESKESNHYVTLSVCLPKEDELGESVKDADYKLIKRSGFVQSVTYAAEQRRKNDLYVFQAGSCFSNRFEGGIYDVSDKEGHPVYRYAKPLFIGI